MPNSKLNFAENLLSKKNNSKAVTFVSENGFREERKWKNLNNNVVIPDNTLIDYKESIIFGFLGVLKLLNINNCYSSVTGSSKDHCSGHIFLP